MMATFQIDCNKKSSNFVNFLRGNMEMQLMETQHFVWQVRFYFGSPGFFSFVEIRSFFE